jgi:hypothetical protein
MGDASGSLADLGVLLPISAALILGNGLDAGTVLVGVGALYLAAGLYFRVPVPVQPIKAAAAIAIARGLPPETIGAAGIVLGGALVLLGVTGLSRVVGRAFSVPIVRGLQLGVGLILMKAAIDLAGPAAGAVGMIVAGAIAVALTVGTLARTPVPIALIAIAGAALFTLVTSGSVPEMEAALWRPELHSGAFEPAVLLSALTLLVIPQIPLTFGNAVVAVVDLEHHYFPRAAGNVTPTRISISCGLANMAAGMLGGMPMCHGSGGLTAHYRAGARTFRMNLVIGVACLTLGLFFGPAALGILSLIPLAVLAGFLGFTGLFHSWLASSLRGFDLLVAVIMGVIGLLTTNLAIGLAAGMGLYWPARWASERKELNTARS